MLLHFFFNKCVLESVNVSFFFLFIYHASCVSGFHNLDVFFVFIGDGNRPDRPSGAYGSAY